MEAVRGDCIGGNRNVAEIDAVARTIRLLKDEGVFRQGSYIKGASQNHDHSVIADFQ